jgi:hypothetical protein
MGKILLVLLLGGIAAEMPDKVIADNSMGAIAGQAPIFAPPALYGAEFHSAPLLAPPAMTVAPVWRERNEWEKRRADQWSELEWQRQQWRENRGVAASENRLNTGAAQSPPSSTSF